MSNFASLHHACDPVGLTGEVAAGGVRRELFAVDVHPDVAAVDDDAFDDVRDLVRMPDGMLTRSGGRVDLEPELAWSDAERGAS